MKTIISNQWWGLEEGRKKMHWAFMGLDVGAKISRCVGLLRLHPVQPGYARKTVLENTY
jgi:hypothetical protein